MNKYGRIPNIPLTANLKDKAIKGEILVNWDGQYLMGKDPSTGEIVRLGDADSLYGIINYIANTNFDQIPDNFEVINGINLSVSSQTGWYKSNELVLDCSSNASMYVSSEYKIYKNKNYTLTFYAKCDKSTTMYIKFDNTNVFPIKIAKSPISKYRLIINTSNFELNYYEGFNISFDNTVTDFNISLSQFMFEYGATANAWTDRTEITSAKVGDLNVNGTLTINGIDIISIIDGGGTKGTSLTANDIVTRPEYMSTKTSDSNYDIISYTGSADTNEIIASKSFTAYLYGTYSIMIRMKSSNVNGTDAIATINVYENSNSIKTLLSTSNIYPYHFNDANVFEELGIVTKFNGTNSNDDEKKLEVEVVAIGDGNTNIKIDFIYMTMAYTSLLPIETNYN